MLENKLAPNQKNKKYNEPIILRYHTFLFLYFRSKKDAKLRTNEWKKRNLYPLYSSSSLSLSLDSRLKTNEEKKGKGRKEDTKWRELPQTMGGREEEEEKKCGTKRNERKREREKRTCACHTSPPSMLIRADDPIRKHAHRSRSRGVFVSRARGLNPARLCWYNIHARVIHSLGDSEQSSSPRFTPTHLLKHSSRTKLRRG